jgi:hypothetical protein
MLDSKFIDTKLKLNKLTIKSIQNGNIDDKEFDTLMLSQKSFGSWISALIICALSHAGVVTMVTILVCIGNYFAAWRINDDGRACGLISLFHCQAHNNLDSN